jgi:hypothetical protein
VLVVAGSLHDQAALKIVTDWAPYDAALLSCEDLSSAGWRHRLADRATSRAVVGRTVVSECDIRGVLVRRPWIMDLELAHIAASDREYVAAEMNAFLISWLTSLTCPVLNRPSGTCLCGPNWRPLQWAHAAARAGITVEAVHWKVRAPRQPVSPDPSASRPPVEVTVVGEQCFGAPDEAHAAGARQLAKIAGTALLRVWFHPGKGTPRFLSATAMPGLKDPEIADAVRDYLLARPYGGPSL